MRRQSRGGDDVSQTDKDNGPVISTRALRAAVSARQQGKYHRENADSSMRSNKLQRTDSRPSATTTMASKDSGDIDCPPPPQPAPSAVPPVVPRLNLGQPTTQPIVPPLVPRLNLGAVSASTSAPAAPVIPKLNLSKSSSVPAPAAELPFEMDQAQVEIKGLKCENMRLLLEKTTTHQRIQELSRSRDSLQAELAKLKTEHSRALLEHKTMAAELAQCQQQLSEVAASSKVASTTSEIYTRALSQTVALRMSHAGEMEELQQVMEEKDEAVRLMEGLVLKLQEELQMMQGSKEQVEQLLEAAASEREKLEEELEEVRREWALALQENKSLQAALEDRVRAEGALAAEKQELMQRVLELRTTLEERAAQQAEPLPSSSAPPLRDLPSALALLERRSVQNETLRQQKRDLEDQLDSALAELQMLREQAALNSALNKLVGEREAERVAQSMAAAQAAEAEKLAVLEQKQGGRKQRQQPQGGGRRALRFALHCVARLGVYSVVAVATVASTHSQKGRSWVDKLAGKGGGRPLCIRTQDPTAIEGPPPQQQEQQQQQQRAQTPAGRSGPVFGDDSPRRRLSRYY